MDLEQQLRAALAPCRPATSLRPAVLARISTAPAARVARRAPNRIILVGTMLAVAAVLTLLVSRGMYKPKSMMPAASVVPMTPAPAPAAPVVEAPPVSAPVAPAATTAEAEPKQVETVIKPFTVRVTTPQNLSKDPATAAAFKTFHEALFDALRGLPGLSLIDAGPAAGQTGNSSYYDISINEFTVLPAENHMRIEMRGSTAVQPIYPVSMHGGLAPTCAGSPECGGPAGSAAAAVMILAGNFFPAPLSRLKEYKSRFLNTSLSLEERSRALSSLGSLLADGIRDPQYSQSGAKRATQDPAVVRGAMDLAATAADQAMRARVWSAMRGVRDVNLVQPLIAALDRDPDSKVRVAALSTLAADFPDDPGVRAALETAARDSSPEIRVLAQRGLVGEAAWNRQVVASLKDASLPAAERTEALLYTMRYVTPKPALGAFLSDDAAIRAFAELYPKAVTSSQADANLRQTLLNSLGSIDHPAITDLQLRNLGSAESSTRRQAAAQLARHADESRVRAALEKVSNEDADAAVREAASKALKAAAAPVAR